MTKFGRRSDPHQVQLWPPGNFITRNAPFGTQDTPSTSVKIIGSKYVPVIETRIKGSKTDGHGGPRRLLVLDPIAEKPTRVDPTLFHSSFRSPRGLAANSSIVQRTTPLGFRPDSKTAKLSPYNTLPPIERHRTKNLMSTVFEPECWTMSPRNFLNGRDGDAGYLGKVDEPDFLNQHLLNNEEMENELTSREVITTDTQTDDYFITSDPDSDRKYLLSLLPRSVYFPSEPLNLSKNDELKLIRVLNKEMQGVQQNQLREIYTVLSTIDRKLTGWCSFQHLTFAFTKKNVHISTDLLRLIAAMFVAPDRHISGVNYEKILSLLGTALKMTDNKKSDEGQDQGSSGANQPLLHYQHFNKGNTLKYFNNSENNILKNSCRQKESPLPDQDIAKLIRISESQLLKADHTINFDRLAASFQVADREHRETLSAAQIKDVCYQNQLPLEEWIIDQILQRCCDASTRQYNWHKFVAFLERVQPIHTGLRIPSSKKPLEYARNYPAPLANWPKATQKTPSESSVPPLWQKDQTSPEKDEQLYEPKSRKTSKDDSPQQTRNAMNYNSQEISQPASRQRTSESQHTINMEAINKLKSQTTSPLDECTEPWFDRFMKLANALYKQDIDHTGFLPLNEVWKLICTYNHMYYLNLSEEKIEKTLAQSMERGQVDLHQILTTLGGVQG